MLEVLLGQALQVNPEEDWPAFVDAVAAMLKVRPIYLMSPGPDLAPYLTYLTTYLPRRHAPACATATGVLPGPQRGPAVGRH